MIETKNYIKKIKWDSILISILTIALGILCVAMPEGSGNVLCIVFGTSLIAMGVCLLCRFFFIEQFLGGSIFILALTMIISGIFFLVYTSDTQSILTVLFGLFIVVDSISSIADSIYCGRAHISGWWVLLILSILTTFLGIAVMFANFSTIMIFAGISLIIEGTTHCITTLIFSYKIKQAKKALLEKQNDIVL